MTGRRQDLGLDWIWPSAGGRISAGKASAVTSGTEASVCMVGKSLAPL